MPSTFSRCPWSDEFTDQVSDSSVTTTGNRFEDFIVHIYPHPRQGGMRMVELHDENRKGRRAEGNTPFHPADGFRTRPPPWATDVGETASSVMNNSGRRISRKGRHQRRQTEASDTTTQSESTSSSLESTLTTTTTTTTESESSTTSLTTTTSTTTNTTTASSSSSSSSSESTSVSSSSSSLSSSSSPSSSLSSSSSPSSSSSSSSTPSSSFSSSSSPPLTSSFSLSSSSISTSRSFSDSTSFSSSSTLSSSFSSFSFTSSTRQSSSFANSTRISTSTLETSQTSTFFSTVTSFTTSFTTDFTSISANTTTQSTSSGVLNTNQPSAGSRFSQNKGAIIGVAVGGVVAMIAAVILLFFLCKRWRRRAAEAFAISATTPTTDNVAGIAGVTRSLSRSFSLVPASGSSSRRPLNRNGSSNETSRWRSPLSDEDVEEALPPPMPLSPSVFVGVASQEHSSSGEDSGNASSSGHGHNPSYSNLHDHPYYQPSGSAVEVGRSNPSFARQNSTQMPGFGQAAEHMAVVGGSLRISPTMALAGTPTSAVFTGSSPSSPTFSVAAAPPPKVTSSSSSPPSAYMMYASSSSHDHSSSGHNDQDQNSGEFFRNRNNPSLIHTNTMVSTGSSTSSGSHSQSRSHGSSSQPTLVTSVPRVRIREASPHGTISKRGLRDRRDSAGSLKGLISRLRGGSRTTSSSLSSPEMFSSSRENSGMEISRGPTTTTASSSYYYPPTAAPPRPSSLLNPPFAPPGLAPPPMPVPPVLVSEESGFVNNLPLGVHSPAASDTSSLVRVTEGLLDPELDSNTREAAVGQLGTSASVTSLRDHVDYSRPYGGLVFNRMASNATGSSVTLETRTPPVGTPGVAMTVEGDEYPFWISR